MFISIITPTYNRARYLDKLANSISIQNPDYLKKLEWIIVDDGSTDNTDEEINIIRDKYCINLKYIKKENGGKHTAVNIGIDNASGEYITIIDSDDYLTDNALNYICNNIDNAVTIFKHGIVNSPDFPKKILTIDEFLSLRGDRIFVFESKFLNEFRFPCHDNERFVTEATIFNKLLDIHKGHCFNLTVASGIYLDDGLSSSYLKLLNENPKGVFDLIHTNLNLTHYTKEIVKQSAYHFSAIFDFNNVIKLLKNESIIKSVVLILATIFVLIKRRLKK